MRIQGASSPVDLTLELCRVESTTGQEAAVMALAAQHCERFGLQVSRQSMPGDAGRVNVFARDPDVAPEVLLTTHLDTVPPYFAPEDRGDKLVGRGTCDAKGAAAAMLCTLEALRATGEKRVGVLFVVGEETISDGARAVVQGFAPHVRYLIDGEPTGMTLVAAQKGTLTFALTAEGKACHSGYPELGASATHALADVIYHMTRESWPSDPALGETTVNVGLVEGGVGTNVVAPKATARGIFRLTVPAELVARRLHALIDERLSAMAPPVGQLPASVKLEVLGQNDPTRLHVPEGEASQVVKFGSDVPYLKALGTPLMLGPGSVHDAHTAHEFVLKADLERAAIEYARLCRKLLVS